MREQGDFRSDEARSVAAALVAAAELESNGQHFSAACVRVVVDYLARAREEAMAMVSGGVERAPTPRAPAVEAEGADVPKAQGAKRGRPPKVKPPASPADVSSEAEPTGAPPSASSMESPPSSNVSPVEVVAVAEAPVVVAAPAAVTA